MSGGGFLAAFDASFNSYLDKIVVTTSSNIAVGIAPIIAVGITIWIMIYGYAVMRQEVSDPINVFVKNVIKVSIILSCSITGGVYQSQIVSAVYGFTDGLSSIVASQSNVQAGGTIEMIDSIFSDGLSLALSIWTAGVAKLPLGGWLDTFAGVLVGLMSIVLAAVCMWPMIVAKFSLAFLLALGPLFIAALIFPATAKFFDNWGAQILNYVILMVLSVMVVVFATLVASNYLAHIQVAAQNGDSATNQVADAFSLTLIYVLLALMVRHLPHIAGGLAGGATLSGGGGGMSQLMMGALLRGGRGGGNSKPSDENAIENGKGNGGASSDNRTYATSQASGSAVPAYKRAAMRKFGGRR